jgi:hypothetical protein
MFPVVLHISYGILLCEVSVVLLLVFGWCKIIVVFVINQFLL